jgi:hypothetical protein
LHKADPRPVLPIGGVAIARLIEPNDYLLRKTPKSGCREIFNIFINGSVSPVRARVSTVDFANELRDHGAFEHRQLRSLAED